MKIYRIILALLCSVAILQANNDGQPAEAVKKLSEEELTKLAEQLGAEDFKIRREARKALIRQGYHAKQVVAKYLAHEDPEVKMNAKKIFEQIQWEIIPGANADISTLTKQLLDNENLYNAWNPIITKYQDQALEILLALTGEKRFKHKIVESLRTLANRLTPGQIARACRKMSDEQREKMIKLTDSFMLEKDETNTVSRNIFYLLYHLGSDLRSFEYGRSVWLTNIDESIIPFCTAAVNRGNMRRSIWEKAGQRMLKTTNHNRNALDLAFHIKLAKELNQPHALKQLLDIVDISQAKPAYTAICASELLEQKRYNDVLTITSGSNDPSLIYMMLHTLSKQQGMPMPEEDWQKVVGILKTEDQIKNVLNHVQAISYEHTEACLKLMIATEPDKSNNDFSAAHQLAYRAKLRGDFSSARKYYQQAIDLNPDMSKTLKDYLANQVTNLEAKQDNTEYSKLIIKANQADYDDEHQKAVELLQEAIKLKPDLLPAYREITRIKRDANDFNDIIPLTKKMTELMPDDSDSMTIKAWRLADIQELDAAEAIIKKIPPIEYGNSHNYLLGNLYDRQGNFAEALKYYELAKDEMEGPVRMIGIVHAESRDFTKAEKAFQDYLAYKPDAYVRVWLHLSRRMLKKDDSKSLAEFAAHFPIDKDDFGRELIEYCLGRLSAEDLLKEAANTDKSWTINSRLCEAHFYIGYMALASGNKADAIKEFQKTLSFKIPVFIEDVWARHELKRLQAR